uniref:Cathepsin H n=1 Tax=Macaca mulatta TaxID=9544 RepID=A0A5F8A2M3_MACMU
MWVTLPLLCAGAWLLGAPVCGAAELSVNSLEKFHFKSWMSKHHKTYSTEEYHHRMQTFASNWRKINAHNNGNHTFKMALNQFSDMSFAEIKHKYLWSEPQNCSATKSNYLRGTGPYPPSMDWRKKGNFVSPVKNQGACGSCWTFSTTGALESAIAIATGKMLSLAEQQLVDCAQDFNNHGCQGGLPSQAFEYILYNKGIMGEDTYPYQGKDGDCKFRPGKAIGFVKDVANITIVSADPPWDGECVLMRRPLSRCPIANGPSRAAFLAAHPFDEFRLSLGLSCCDSGEVGDGRESANWQAGSLVLNSRSTHAFILVVLFSCL